MNAYAHVRKIRMMSRSAQQPDARKKALDILLRMRDESVMR